jgi:hypothetical protein
VAGIGVTLATVHETTETTDAVVEFAFAEAA